VDRLFQFVDAEKGAAVRETLLREGASYGVDPPWSAAYEMLRVEYGLPAPGREMGERFDPLEARLGAELAALPFSTKAPSTSR